MRYFEILEKARRGDILLYKAKGFFGLVIRIKTWHKEVHCEIYAGNGRSLASRDGIGVRDFELREDGIYAILRPKERYSWEHGYRWFKATAEGQGYDWLGILGFVFQNSGAMKKQFCSEFIVRFFRRCGLDLFPGEDADRVAPFQLGYHPDLEVIWKAW